MSKAEVMKAADAYAASDGDMASREALETIMDRIDGERRNLANVARETTAINSRLHQEKLVVEQERDRFAKLLLEAVITFEKKGEMPTLCADARQAMGTPL